MHVLLLLWFCTQSFFFFFNFALRYSTSNISRWNRSLYIAKGALKSAPAINPPYRRNDLEEIGPLSKIYCETTCARERTLFPRRATQKRGSEWDKDTRRATYSGCPLDSVEIGTCRSYVETVASGTDNLLVCRIASYIVFVLLMRSRPCCAYVRQTLMPHTNTIKQWGRAEEWGGGGGTLFAATSSFRDREPRSYDDLIFSL